MTITFNYFVFLEAHNYCSPHNKIKGATSRLTAIVADRIKREYGVCVHYISIKENQKLEDIDFNFQKINKDDIGIFIRFQYQTTLEIMTQFQKFGGIAILHFTDPHILNQENLSRLELHKNCLEKADGVIATSERLAQIARQFVSPTKQSFVFHIPDTVDVNYRQPQINQVENKLRLITSCYPLHHESIFYSLSAVENFAQKNQVTIDYKLVTSEPRQDQQQSHGQKSWLEQIKNYQSELLKISHIPFSVDNLEKALCDSDAYLIQAVKTDSQFKRIWIPSKGAIRVVQAYAAGISVIFQGNIGETLPLSYQAFTKWSFYGDDLEKLLEQFSQTPIQKVLEKVKDAQNYIKQYHDPEIIAQQYFEAFKSMRKKY